MASKKPEKSACAAHRYTRRASKPRTVRCRDLDGNRQWARIGRARAAMIVVGRLDDSVVGGVLASACRATSQRAPSKRTVLQVKHRLAMTGMLCAALAWLPGAAAAKTKASAPEPAPWPAPQKLKMERFTLNNGLRVVVQPDHSAPLVAVGLMVDVGSRDETKGKSGLAHFFEHMMFQGSKRVGKMEHFTALESVGADLNANTSTDRTYYYEVVPKGALELALWMEADRFSSLAINTANVENQRQTVMEERRQRYGNQPYALSRLELRKKAFTTWELAHTTIGSMADLKAAPVADFEAFWLHWYTPNNVVLALVGDITVERAREVSEKYLGQLERRAEPQKKAFAEPTPTAHSYTAFAEPLGKMPAFHIAWRVPAKPHPDAYAIEVLSEVLDGSDAARLRKKLSKDTGIATRHFAGVYGQRDVDLFHVFAELSQSREQAIEKAKQIVRETIYDIAANGVRPDELQRAKVSYEAGWVFGIESLSGRAAALCRHELYYGDANRFNDELGRYRKVTEQDIVRVARKYFTWQREVEMDVLPKGMAAAKGAGEKPRYVQKAEAQLIKSIEKRAKAEEKQRLREEKRREKAAAKAAKLAARAAAREAKQAARDAKKAAALAKKQAASDAKQAASDAKQAASDAVKAASDAKKAASDAKKAASDAEKAASDAEKTPVEQPPAAPTREGE